MFKVSNIDQGTMHEMMQIWQAQLEKNVMLLLYFCYFET